MHYLSPGKALFFRAGVLLIAATTVLAACVPPEGPGSKRVQVDLSDPEARKIWTYQNEHRADSLVYYLGHPQATYRYLAALSFASFQAPALADSSLLDLLSDPIDSVRMAAAYAIGQWRDSTYAVELADGFDQRDTAGRYRRANAAILEAIGKCAPASYLDFLANVTSYRPTDTILQKGLAWGIYRFGLRDITSRAGTRRMVGYVLDSGYAPEIRRVAAFYLSRIAGNLTDLPDQAALIRAYTTEQDTWTRWALSVAAGKTGTAEALQALQAQYLLEEDERLRGEIMRALRFLPYEGARPLALKGLRDNHPLVHWLAARFFLEQGNPADLSLIASWAFNDSLSWPARLTMARATMRHFPPYATQGRRAFSYKLRFEFLQAKDPYQKAAWLQAVAEEGWNYRFIRREGFQAAHPAVRTASVAALRTIAARPDFEDYFGQGYRGRTAELAAYFREAIATGDPGMISEAAAALRIPERDFGRYLDSLAFLDQARGALQLPQDLEAVRELDHTLAYLKGETHQPGSPPAARTLSWDALRDEPLTARLATEKGTIELELWPQLAPATVSAFLDLAGQAFYNGKSFHRVVPNFVVQDGCPRGDGYGGADFLLRSELPYVHYEEGGLIGMASAGRHTEGSQFFITQVPTPHLDGRYTLFGRVRSGAEVLTRIMPGDSIVQFTVSQ